MFSTMRNAWATPDLRKKILFTLFVIVMLRFDAAVTVSSLNVEALQGLMGQVSESGNTLEYLDMLSSGAFVNATSFAMSITPYISSSITLRLLTIALPPLGRSIKEGEEGHKRIAAITRYVIVALGLIQSTAHYFCLYNSSCEGAPIAMFNSGREQAFSTAVITFTFTVGTALMIRMGEQVNKYGIGNGTSILLFSDIMACMPYIMNMSGKCPQVANQGPSTYGRYYMFILIFVILLLAVIWFIVLMNNSERRILIRYVKRVVGRKMYGGQASHIPIEIVMSGVIPIIFTSSILAILGTIQLSTGPKSSFWRGFLDAFSSTGWMYSPVYSLLTIMFAYFYATIQYNPIKMISSLRQSNGMVPGARPGEPASDFIFRILFKLTLIGALFPAIVALLPIIFGAAAGMHNMSLDGTSLTILVGVALDTVKQMKSQTVMCHYKGFLD